MFTDYLKQTAEIYELRASRDSLGGVFQAWTYIATSICLVQPSRGGVGRDDEKDGSAATHMILLPGAWDLTAANQVRVDGKTYNVVACRDWNSLGRTHPAGHTTVSAVVETS